MKRCPRFSTFTPDYRPIFCDLRSAILPTDDIDIEQYHILTTSSPHTSTLPTPTHPQIQNPIGVIMQTMPDNLSVGPSVTTSMQSIDAISGGPRTLPLTITFAGSASQLDFLSSLDCEKVGTVRSEAMGCNNTVIIL